MSVGCLSAYLYLLQFSIPEYFILFIAVANPLVSSPNACYSQGEAEARAGAGSAMQIPRVSSRNPVTESAQCLPPPRTCIGRKLGPGARASTAVWVAGVFPTRLNTHRVIFVFGFHVPATLLNLLVIAAFLVDDLGFSTSMNVSSASRDYVTSPFLIWMSFLSFSYQITLARASVLC